MGGHVGGIRATWRNHIRLTLLPSLLEHRLADCVSVVLSAMAERGGAIDIDAAGDLVWSTLGTHYRLDHATAEWRKHTERDVQIALALLVRLGALTDDAGTFRLTPLADWAQRRRYGGGRPGELVAQVRVTLRHIDPPVWRRLLVPASIRLDRLHRVIQAAMGWQDYHLHVFNHETGHYGIAEPELQHRDKAKRRCTTSRAAKATHSSMSTTLATVGITRSSSRSWSLPNLPPITRSAWPANARVRRRIVAARTATRR